MQATPTTASRNSSASLVRFTVPRTWARTAVSSTGSTSPATGPAISRAVDRVRRRDGSREPRPARSWVTRWTSMSPDSSVTVSPVPGPVRNRSRRPRRLVPSTSWVAFSARANSTSAVAMPSPTTEW